MANKKKTSRTAKKRLVNQNYKTEPVGNRRYTCSCVGWASAYGFRNWLRYKATGQRQPKFSLRFVWMGAGEHPYKLNMPLELFGTRTRDAFKLMRKFGACPDKPWPFPKLLPNPDDEANIKREAMKYRIGIFFQNS